MSYNIEQLRPFNAMTVDSAKFKKENYISFISSITASIYTGHMLSTVRTVEFVSSMFQSHYFYFLIHSEPD